MNKKWNNPISPLPDVFIGSEEPLYNIGVVARMTGVSMATLRAWERRYNFPELERTAGGHRLYSEKDVLCLRWVKERINEGMHTAIAINALHRQEQTGKISFVETLSQTTPESRTEQSSSYLHNYQRQLLEALQGRDLVSAENTLGELLAISSPEYLIMDVIGPTLTQIGCAWEEGNISIATEHLATNFLRQRLLMWMLSGPPPKPGSPIVLACAPNEWHEGSLLILGALLRRRRWPVAYLGQAVPLPDLAGFVRDLHPDLVVLIAMTESSAAELAEWEKWMPEIAQTGKPILSYGGRIFKTQPDWRSKMSGFYLGDDFREGLHNIERLLLQIG